MKRIDEPHKPEPDGPQAGFTKLSPIGLGIGACMVVALIALAATAPKAPIKKTEKASVLKHANAPADYKISLAAKQVSDAGVEMKISTNLPLPVEVMVGVTVDGLRDEETYVGYNERITLSSANTTFLLDTAKSGRTLPSTSYLAEVSFYPKWGAEGNSAAQKAPKLDANAKLQLKTAGAVSISTASVNQQSERRKWIMENVHMRMPWNERQFVNKLGQFEKTAAEMSPQHDAYYFSGADMTLIVNRVRNEVTIWRDGRNTN